MLDFIIWTFTVVANNTLIQYIIPVLGIILLLSVIVDWVFAIDKVLPKIMDSNTAIITVLFFIAASGVSLLFGLGPNQLSEYWIGLIVVYAWGSLVFLMGYGLYKVLAKIRSRFEK